jgi:lipoprotein NlpI
MSVRPYIGCHNPSMGSSAHRPGSFRAVFVIAGTLTLLVCGACRAEDDSSKAGTVNKAQDLLKAAGSAYNAGRFEEAAKNAQEASAAAPDEASVQQSAGQVLFLSGKVHESLPCFEKANQLDTNLAPHNWQRGVALGCVGKFDAGAEQFGMHHEVNPDDVENSAWYFLCVAKTKGKAAAEKTVIPSRGDRRQPMMSVLKMLQGTLTPDEVLVAAKENTKEGADRKMAMFYGFLYVGLYYDSIGEIEKAASALDSAITFADKDYMGRTAQIYRELRFEKRPSDQPAPAAPK